MSVQSEEEPPSGFDPVIIASRLRQIGDQCNMDFERVSSQVLREVLMGKVKDASSRLVLGCSLFVGQPGALFILENSKSPGRSAPCAVGVRDAWGKGTSSLPPWVSAVGSGQWAGSRTGAKQSTAGPAQFSAFILNGDLSQLCSLSLPKELIPKAWHCTG